MNERPPGVSLETNDYSKKSGRRECRADRRYPCL